MPTTRMPSAAIVVLSLVAPAAGEPASAPWRTVSRTPAVVRPSSGGDRLLLYDGTTMLGTLVGCGGSACRFNNDTVVRARIDWIGLGGAMPPPPQLADPGKDSVFLAGGEVKIESLVGVNAHEVVTDGGSYPRGDVRWIHVAPQGSQGGDQQPAPTPIVAATPPGGDQGSGGPGPTPPPPASPIPTPPPGDRPTPPPPPTKPSPPHRAPPPGGGKFELGAVWTGVVSGRWWGDKPEAHTVVKFRARVRLREYRYPLIGITRETMGKRIGTLVRLEHEGTVLTSHFDQSGRWGACRGQGTTTLSYALDERGVDHASKIYLKTADVDFAGQLGFDVPRHGGLYIVDLATNPNVRFSASCEANGGTFTQMEPFTTPVLGRSPLGPHLFPFEDPELRSLSLNDGQMAGHFQAPAVGAFDHLEVEWSICREGVRCSQPGAPGGPGDDCPQTTEADSRVDTNRTKYEAYAREIAGRWLEYQKQMEEARAHLRDFQTTMRVCNVQNWIGNLLVALLAPEEEAVAALDQALEEGGSAALSAEERAALTQGGLKQVAEMVDKIVKGENPFTTMLPEDVQTALELFGVASKLAGALQGSTAEQLGQALEECAGTAGITQGQYSSAEEYVSGLKTAVGQLADIQKLVNDVKQLDNELPDLQYQAYRACVERARCQNRPDSDCDGLKPAGNWPEVP